MAHYMTQVSYNPRAYQTLVNNPQDRGTAIRSVVEAMGGRMESFYFAFGDYDV